MKINWLTLILGVVLFLVGLVWALQGLGVIGGSAMSGVTMWAIIGPILAIVGIVLVVITFVRARRSPKA